MVSENEKVKNFLNAADEWICDSYTIDIRYIALKEGESVRLLEASILLNPLPPAQDMSFHIETLNLYAGQKQLIKQSKSCLMDFMKQAVQGKIDIDNKCFSLSAELDFHSEMSYRNR